jgi:hypothetical protein
MRLLFASIFCIAGSPKKMWVGGLCKSLEFRNSLLRFVPPPWFSDFDYVGGLLAALEQGVVLFQISPRR